MAPALRSMRSFLIYQAVFRSSGIHVQCVPVTGRPSVSEWDSTWHGIQEVVLQFAKLQYYRWYVLPFRMSDGSEFED